MVKELISDIHLWMDGIPAALQWLMLIVLGGLPLIEALLGSMIGTLLGLHPLLSVPAALLGNLLSVTLCATFGKRIRLWWQHRRARHEGDGKNHRLAPSEIEGREEARLTALLRRYGATGLCLLGPFILPSQAVALVASGTSLPRNRIIALIMAPATILGITGGTLGYLGINLLTR